LGIVKGHHGFFEVQSKEGFGTRVDLFFPATKVCSVTEPDQHPRYSQANGDYVLLVDDEPTIRSVLETLLKRNGYNVLSAESGENALALHDRYSIGIHIVLTDLMMPGMDGKRLIAELRQRDKDLPIVLMTGALEEADQTAIDPLGLAGVISKPLSLNEVLGALEAQLRGNTGRSSLKA